MARKLTHDFGLILGLSAILPFIVAAGLLYSWQRSDVELSKVKSADQYLRAQKTIESALQRIIVVTDMVAASSDIVDYVMAPEESRIYLSLFV